MSRRLSLSTANLAIFTAITAVLDGVDRRAAALATVIARSGSAPQVFIEHLAPPGAEAHA